MPAALKVLAGPLQERVLVLPGPGASPFLLGRSLEAGLTLGGPQVEDRHAAVVPDGGGHRLVPLATRKGLWLGEEPVRETRVLQDGDRLRIGRHLLVYQGESQRGAIGTWGGLPATRPCAACGDPIGPDAGSATLQALQLGLETICPRCVDLRLHVDRDLDTYRILRKIGVNDEEVTYLAVDRETNERVAIRILKANRQADLRCFRRFLVRGLSGLVLDHANYLPVRAIRSSGGITYVVLEHLEHSTKLEAVVREASPLTLPEAIIITNQLAEVLRYARERQLVVAKRKKSGVLVDHRLWVKVLAFDVTTELERTVASTSAFADLAQRSGHDPDALATTHLAPRTSEEERLSRPASEFAEVYSVGRILYQLLAARSFSTGTIDLVRAATKQLADRGAVVKGPLAGVARPGIELLERVIVPSGPDRLRTLDAFTRASKAAFRAATEA